MKFLGVSGVFDYAGPNKSSRYRACSCCLPRITKTSASGLHLFGAEYPPHLSSIYYLRFTVSLAVAAQDSRPSGSLLLSRKALTSSTSCRFNPAHCNGDVTSTTAGPTFQKPRSSRNCLIANPNSNVCSALRLPRMECGRRAPCFVSIQRVRVKTNLRDASPRLLRLGALGGKGVEMENFIHLSHEVAS